MQMEVLTGHYLMNGNGPLDIIKSPVAHKHTPSPSPSPSLPLPLSDADSCSHAYPMGRQAPAEPLRFVAASQKL